MKYSLMVRSRIDPKQAIPDKHTEFVRSYSQSGDSWPFIGEFPPPPEIGHHLVAIVKLKKYLHQGWTGTITYKFREPNAEDRAYNDDHITLDFLPKKQDYQRIIGEIFPRLIVAFRAYRVQILDERFYHLDFERQRAVNDRHGVYRIFPVAFYDRELCLRAFNLSSEEIVVRLAGKAESVRLFQDGVLLVVRSNPLTLEEAESVDLSIREALKTG